MPDVDIKMLQVKDVYGGFEFYNPEYEQGASSLYLYKKKKIVVGKRKYCDTG